MSHVVYEHPLNEKVRLLMRLELVFNSLEQYRDSSLQQNIHPFFRALFDCVEILERNDVRSTLTYYLDQFEKSLVRWADHPGVMNDVLEDNLRESVRLQAELSSMTKACQQLKDEKFLASLRQRFGIAAGSCDFDLPQLHFWRSKPISLRKLDIDQWLSILLPLKQSLNFSLLFLRESAGFNDKVAVNGFYQDVSGENASLLRIRYDITQGFFPTVSGSKRRYSISFMQPDKCSVKTNIDDTVQFQLAEC